jgi:hypothetical protein
MNKLKKRHDLNVDVRKKGSIFAKCIVCETLRDLISKLGRNSSDVKEYEPKLTSCINSPAEAYTIFGSLSLCVPKMNSYVLSMTKWIM